MKVSFECLHHPRPKRGEYSQREWDKVYGLEDAPRQGCGHRWTKTMTELEYKAMFGENGKQEPCPRCGKTRPIGYSTASLDYAFNKAM